MKCTGTTNVIDIFIKNTFGVYKCNLCSNLRTRTGGGALDFQFENYLSRTQLFTYYYFELVTIYAAERVDVNRPCKRLCNDCNSGFRVYSLFAFTCSYYNTVADELKRTQEKK